MPTAITPPVGPSSLPSSAPARPARSFGAQLERAVGRIETATPEPPGGQVSATSLAERALSSSRELDSMIAQARSGATFSPQELIALQARVFRCTQTIEVFAKTVEQTTSAAKQTLGTQV